MKYTVKQSEAINSATTIHGHPLRILFLLRSVLVAQSLIIQSKKGKKEAIALAIRSQSTGFGIAGSAVSHPRLKSQADTLTLSRKKARLIARLGFA
jgi:hypothetical protein